MKTVVDGDQTPRDIDRGKVGKSVAVIEVVYSVAAKDVEWKGPTSRMPPAIS